MGVTLILEVWQIPDGTEVTKPTGTTPYTLIKGGLKCYAEHVKGEKNIPVIYGKDQCFLGNGGHTYFSAVGPCKKLAVHFETRADCRAWLTDTLTDDE